MNLANRRHFTIYKAKRAAGTHERFIGFLIEHYAGIQGVPTGFDCKEPLLHALFKANRFHFGGIMLQGALTVPAGGVPSVGLRPPDSTPPSKNPLNFHTEGLMSHGEL
jgi:hypothetical protein